MSSKNIHNRKKKLKEKKRQKLQEKKNQKEKRVQHKTQPEIISDTEEKIEEEKTEDKISAGEISKEEISQEEKCHDEKSPDNNLAEVNCQETKSVEDAEDKQKVKRKPSVFKIVLLSYSILILIGGVVLIKYLWDRLSSFQANYEEAMENANPDLVIGDYTNLFLNDNIENLVSEEWDDISPYETDINKKSFISEHVSDEDIRWERRSDFSDLKPKYDIFSNDNYLGAVALKQKNAVDDYGFHLCELDYAQVGFAPENLKSIIINAYEGTQILINGVPLSERCIESQAVENSIDKAASEETGTVYLMNTYKLTGFFEYPEVCIQKNGYICDMETIKDENDVQIYSQRTMYRQELFEELNNRTLEIAKAYDLYAAGIREIGSVGPYFLYSGNGYKMLSGLAFDISIAGTTTVYDILNAQTGNLLEYSEEDAVIDSYQTIHRVHRNIEYDEDINIRWYLKKVNNSWKVKDFSMKL